MTIEPISHSDALVIRRVILAPGEATPWHTDPCRRFTVVVRTFHLSSPGADPQPEVAA